MLQKDFFNMGEQRSTAYSTPSVNIMKFQSVAVLCQSFDPDNNTEIFDREEIEDL